MLIAVQCSQSSDKKAAALSQKDSTVCSSKKPLNPNGDSELALLMRSMNTSTASFRELIKQGKLPEKFPEEFLKIHTAKPTDPATSTPIFEGFATSYLNGLNKLYASPKDQLTSNFNIFVQGCVDCHQQFCPGPIKTINKLKI